MLVEWLARGMGVGRRNPERFLPIAMARELRRTEKRIAVKERKRAAPRPEECEALYDAADVESMVIAETDWDRGRRLVQGEQRKVLEARLEGVNLQGTEAPDYLGWDPEYLDSVRRSLEPDRPDGRRLRRYFQAYEGVPNRRRTSR